jgi:acyl-CoA thioesterase
MAEFEFRTNEGAGTAARGTPQPASEFDAATGVQRTSDERWTGRVHDGWDMGGVANGGYLMSIAAAALLDATGRRDVIVATAHFVAPATVGPIDVRVETVRAGGRLSSAVAALRQHGREIARILATLGDFGRPDEARIWDAAPPQLPDPDRCVHATTASGLAFQPPPITARVELRLKPEHAGFALGRPGGLPEMSGWARLADGRAADTRSLLLFADAFPPAIFNAGLPLTWIPTIELSVQVRKRPAAGWLRCTFRTRFLSGGYLEEDGELWDADGDVVALSRQLALAPRPERG